MIQNLDSQILFFIIGIPISATLFYTWIAIAVLVILSICATHKITSQKNPSKLQVLMEMMVTTIADQIHDVSNDKPQKYLSLIGTFFFLIAISNLLTIFPWYDPSTSSLSTTAAFASIVFFAIPYYGIKNAGIKGYLKIHATICHHAAIKYLVRLFLHLRLGIPFIREHAEWRHYFNGHNYFNENSPRSASFASTFGFIDRHHSGLYFRPSGYCICIGSSP